MGGEDGSIFTDRSGRLFEHVLEFLRCGVLPEDPSLRRRLLVETDFFSIPALRAAIEEGVGEECDFTRKELLVMGSSGKPLRLAGVVLCGLNLKGLDLTDANLRGADLRRVNLQGAILCGADLTG